MHDIYFPQQPYEVGTVVIPTTPMMKPRHREENQLAQGREVGEERSCPSVRYCDTLLGFDGEPVFKMDIFFPFSEFLKSEVFGAIPVPPFSSLHTSSTIRTFSGSVSGIHATPMSVSQLCCPLSSRPRRLSSSSWQQPSKSLSLVFPPPIHI